MYLQTSRLQYNLQKVGVFQKAHSDKNIQAEACRYIIPQKCEQFKRKAYIRTPKSGLDNRISRPPLLNCLWVRIKVPKQPPPVMVTGALTSRKSYDIIMLQTLMVRLSHLSICQKHIIHTTKYYLKKCTHFGESRYIASTQNYLTVSNRISIFVCSECSGFLFFPQPNKNAILILSLLRGYFNQPRKVCVTCQ